MTLCVNEEQKVGISHNTWVGRVDDALVLICMSLSVALNDNQPVAFSSLNGLKKLHVGTAFPSHDKTIKDLIVSLRAVCGQTKSNQSDSSHT